MSTQPFRPLPPPLEKQRVPDPNALNVGVLKAILVSLGVVLTLGVAALLFLRDRAEAERIRLQTEQNIQQTRDAVKRSEAAREALHRGSRS